MTEGKLRMEQVLDALRKDEGRVFRRLEVRYPFGNEVYPLSWRCIRRNGRMVELGTSGDKGEFRAFDRGLQCITVDDLEAADWEEWE